VLPDASKKRIESSANILFSFVEPIIPMHLKRELKVRLEWGETGSIVFDASKKRIESR